MGPRFDGLYGFAYDAVITRPTALRAARLVVGPSTALDAIPELVRTAYADAPNEPLLDLPCGSASSLVHGRTVERTARVVGVDASEPMLARGRRRAARLQPAYDVELIHADATTVPFDTGTFGAALSINGLHCIDERHRFIDEVARVLRSGAMFTLTTLVSADSPRSRIVNDVFRRGGVIPAAPPTLDTLMAWLEAAGFADVELVDGTELVALRCRRQ